MAMITVGAGAALAGLFPQYLAQKNLDQLSIIGAFLMVVGSMLGSFNPSPTFQAMEG